MGVLEYLPGNVKLALRWYGKGISEENQNLKKEHPSKLLCVTSYSSKDLEAKCPSRMNDQETAVQVYNVHGSPTK